jgi:hypothetical protein
MCHIVAVQLTRRIAAVRDFKAYKTLVSLPSTEHRALHSPCVAHGIQLLQLQCQHSGDTRLRRSHHTCLCRSNESNSDVTGSVCCVGSNMPSVVARRVLLSTSRIRQTPLFIIVVFDIFLGIAISFWMTTTTVRPIPGCLIIYNLTDSSQFGFLLKPLAGFPRTSFIAVAIVTFLSPGVIDLVLILRLYAVFPMATTPRRNICAVFAFTACIKMARLGFGIANAALWVPTVPQDPSTAYSPSNSHSVHSSWQKAAAACDLIDHMCVELVSSEVWRLTTILILALLLLASYGSCVSASVHCSVPRTHRVRRQVSTVATSAWLLLVMLIL